MRRRAFLAGGAGTAVALTALTGCAEPSAEQDQQLAEGELQDEAAKLRERFKAVSYTHLTLPTTPYV